MRRLSDRGGEGWEWQRVHISLCWAPAFTKSLRSTGGLATHGYLGKVIEILFCLVYISTLYL